MWGYNICEIRTYDNDFRRCLFIRYRVVYCAYVFIHTWPYTLVSLYQSLNVYIYNNPSYTLPIEEIFDGRTTYTSVVHIDAQRSFIYFMCHSSSILNVVFLRLSKQKEILRWTYSNGTKCSCIKTSYSNNATFVWLAF